MTAMARRSVQKDKKVGVNKTRLTLPCMRAVQSEHSIYFFKMKASLAWTIFSISRKEPESNKGYPDSRPEFTQIVARQFSTTL